MVQVAILVSCSECKWTKTVFAREEARVGYRRLRTDLLDSGVTDGDIRLRQLIKVVLAKENDSLQTASP